MLGLLAVPLGVLLWRQVFETLPPDELAALRIVHRQLATEFVEQEDPHDLLVKAIQGMVRAVDRHGDFIVKDDVADFEARELEGTYEGIGILLVENVTPITVQCPLANSPAERAGVQVGDRILAADGVELTDVAAADAVTRAAAALRGPAGSKVTLRIARGETPPFEVTIDRDHVPQAKVKWARLLDADQRLGYVHVASFQRGVGDEFLAAVHSLGDEAGGALDGLVIDLRQNGGGMLTEAVRIANAFVESGRIVTLHKRGVEVERHDALPERCLWPKLPLVVLVNHNTASASEVLTGALQDHERAAVVGTRTYGKASVQSIFSFRDREFRLKLTTARYSTPKGRDIDGEGGVAPPANPHVRNGNGGIAPDVTAELAATAAERVHGALRASEVPAVYRAAVAELSKVLAFTPARPAAVDDDPQLAAALATLRERVASTHGR